MTHTHTNKQRNQNGKNGRVAFAGDVTEATKAAPPSGSLSQHIQYCLMYVYRFNTNTGLDLRYANG